MPHEQTLGGSRLSSTCSPTSMPIDGLRVGWPTPSNHRVQHSLHGIINEMSDQELLKYGWNCADVMLRTVKQAHVRASMDARVAMLAGMRR